MIAIPRYTPLVTLFAVGYYFFFATRVARARIKFRVELPATSGHPVFDRVHVNTLEAARGISSVTANQCRGACRGSSFNRQPAPCFSSVPVRGLSCIW